MRGIIRASQRLCKTDLHPEVPAFVRAQMKTHGKTKLRLQKGQYLEQIFDEEKLWLFLINEACQLALGREKEALATAGVATCAGWKKRLTVRYCANEFATRWAKSAT
jgi:hypothetical protein